MRIVVTHALWRQLVGLEGEWCWWEAAECPGGLIDSGVSFAVMPTAMSDAQLTGDRQVLKLCLLPYFRVDLSFSSISAAEDTEILVVLQTSDQTYFVRKFVHFST